MATRSRAAKADSTPQPKLVKKCQKCGNLKPVTEFRRHKGHGDGYDSRCKACMRADEAAKKRLGQQSAVADVAPKPRESLGRAHRRMVDPYLALRDHQARCTYGCDKDADLIAKAADAFELFFNEYSADSLGGLPAHAKQWVTAALTHPRLLLNVPPRHAKTTIMAIWFPIWQWACDRNTQVIIISKTVALGEKISRKVDAELTSNVKLIADFGRFRPADLSRPWRTAKGELEIEGKDLSLRSGDLSLQIRGSGQQILGMEADWAIADDITDRRVSVSETERNTEWDFFLGDVMTRLAPRGKAFCVGQRVHSEDIYGRLARLQDDDGTPAWHQVKTPAILDEETGKVLWPDVWPLERLVDRRKAVGSALFACMYQQAPEYAGDFVQRWWLEGNGSAETPGCYDRNRSVGQGWKLPPDQLGFIPVTRVISIDPSPTAYCGIVVADVVWQRNSPFFYTALVDISRDRMGLRQMVDEVTRLTKQYGPQVCIFETNIAKWLSEDPAWNRLTPMFQTVIGQQTTHWNKADTLMGVWSLAGDFEGGRIRFPWQGPEDRERMEPLISEILAYPNGQTDDVLMALWFIKANYKRLTPRDLLPTRFTGGGPNNPNAWNMGRMKSMWNERTKYGY